MKTSTIETPFQRSTTSQAFIRNKLTSTRTSFHKTSSRGWRRRRRPKWSTKIPCRLTRRIHSLRALASSEQLEISQFSFKLAPAHQMNFKMLRVTCRMIHSCKKSSSRFRRYRRCRSSTRANVDLGLLLLSHLRLSQAVLQGLLPSWRRSRCGLPMCTMDIIFRLCRTWGRRGSSSLSQLLI